MSKHTPGPWILSETSVLRYGDTLPTKICEIFCSNNNKVICEIPDYRYHAEYDVSDRADAHLLTAAPDLLEALEELERSVFAGSYEDPSHDRIFRALKDARAAIVRARGEA